MVMIKIIAYNMSDILSYVNDNHPIEYTSRLNTQRVHCGLPYTHVCIQNTAACGTSFLPSLF
jgi:hypothetical protein